MSLNIFSDQQLRHLVDTVITPVVPPGHDLAIVGGVDQQGVQVVATFARSTGDDQWNLVAAARHDWTGDNSIGAYVMFSR